MLVWSLRCPLLLGVGPAWCRRTGDTFKNCMTPLLLKVLLLWMTLLTILGSVGFRAENEYMNNVGSNRANTVKLFELFFVFLKEIKCRVWCILHMFLWNVNMRSDFSCHHRLHSSDFCFQTKHLRTVTNYFRLGSLVAGRCLGRVRQRSAAGWNARLLRKVTTVIGNRMWTGIAVLSDESLAGLLCQMFTPDVFVQFRAHAGEVAAVAVSLPANKLRHFFHAVCDG